MGRFRIKDLLISPLGRADVLEDATCGDKNPLTKQPCWKHGQKTTIPCKEDSNTRLPCQRDSKTKKSCRLDKELTKWTCYENWEPVTYAPCYEKSRVPCSDRDDRDDTSTPCRDRRTTDCAPDHPKTYRPCPSNQPNTILPTAEGFQACADASETYPGVLACPPLSPLDLPPSSPFAAEALAILHEELRSALNMVEARQDEVADALRPDSVEEAEALERKLENALDELRDLKQKLRDRGDD